MDGDTTDVEIDGEADWGIRDGAIAERPRGIPDHPLLDAIYDRHDELIAEHVDGEVLELAFGTRPYPGAAAGVDAWRENCELVRGLEPVLGDARALPFVDDSFDGVVGRRFIHHVEKDRRLEMFEEIRRVLRPGGVAVVLEGTPGRYRRVVKGIGHALGVLGENNDLYGHLTPSELTGLFDAVGIRIIHSRALGSPLMPLSVLRSDFSRRLAPFLEGTQFVRWWTLVVGDVVD